MASGGFATTLPMVARNRATIPCHEYSRCGILCSMLETFRALAEPSRLQIVDLLLKGPLSVGEVVDQLGIRQPQASKHLRVLAESGLVEIHPDAQRRIYALRAQRLRELDRWLQRYRRLWEEQFERLDQVLEELQAKPKSNKGKTKRLRRRRSKARPR